MKLILIVIAGLVSGLVFVLGMFGGIYSGNVSQVVTVYLVFGYCSYLIARSNPNLLIPFVISYTAVHLFFAFSIGSDENEVFHFWLSIALANSVAGWFGGKLALNAFSVKYVVILIVSVIPLAMQILDNAKPSSEKSDVGTSILNTEIQMAEGDKVESGTDSLP